MKGTMAFGIAAAVMAVSACTTDSSKPADTAAAAITPTPTPAVVDSGTTAPPASGTSASGAMLDPNSATSSDLAGVAGITPDLAASLVAARPFSNMTAVDAILAKSLSEQQRDSVYTRLWMPIDLNKASGNEIMLIPGVGPRMRHEFEEYRPYTSIEQFRREIGKYVDKEEVARLERYVRI